MSRARLKMDEKEEDVNVGNEAKKNYLKWRNNTELA